MISNTRIVPPAGAGRLATPLRTAEGPPAAVLALPISPEPPETVLAPQDDFAQTSVQGNATPAETQRTLDPLLTALQNQSGLGAEASHTQVLDNFRTTVIPDAISQLNQRIESLAQADSTPENQLALNNARASLVLYEQAETMLANSPLLSTPLSPDSLSEMIQAAVVPVQDESSYRSRLYDEYIGTPQSSETLFNQRKSAIDEQITALETAAETASPEDAAKYGRIQRVMQELSDLYGSFPDYVQNGDGFLEDVSSLVQRIGSVSEALTAAGADINEEDAAAIDTQLRDFTTLATELSTLPNRPGNLGYSINFTYKRVGEIQAGKRTRETPDISGALASYVNDRQDMEVFVSRFDDLRADIRSGNLRGQGAINAALAAIPGTSNRFKTVFTQIIQAELDLAEAARLRASAEADLAEGNAQASEGEQNVSAAQDANRSGTQSGQQARGAADAGDFEGSRTDHGRAVTAQQEGAARAASAQDNVDAAQVAHNSAAGKAARARGLTGSAARGANQASQSDFGVQLERPIRGTRQEVSRSTVGDRALRQGVEALGARADALQQDVDEVTAENRQLQQQNVADENYIDTREAYAQQNQQNQQTLETLDQILTAGTAREFGLSLEAKLGIGPKGGGAGAAVSGQIKVALDGKVGSDGSVAFDISLDVGVSVELKAFIVELEAAIEVGGSYGLRFSPEDARLFGRLFNDMVTTLGNEGISPNAEQARNELFALMRANTRTETRVTASGSASVGTEENKSSLGAEVEISRTVQNRSIDSNGNGRFDASDAVGSDVSYKASLTVETQLNGRTYTGVIQAPYNSDTGSIGAPELSLEVSGTAIPEEALQNIIAQGINSGIVDAEQGISRGSLSEASRALQTAGPALGGEQKTKVSVDFEDGSLTLASSTRREIDEELGIAGVEGNLKGYDEVGSSVTVTT